MTTTYDTYVNISCREAGAPIRLVYLYDTLPFVLSYCRETIKMRRHPMYIQFTLPKFPAVTELLGVTTILLYRTQHQEGGAHWRLEAGILTEKGAG